MQDWIIVLGVVPFIIGMCGQVARNIVLGNNQRQGDVRTGIKRLYWATLPLHALGVGAWVGTIGYKYGLPVPEAFGDTMAGSILAYTMSGGISVVGYDAIVKTIRRMLDSYRGQQPTEPERRVQGHTESPNDRSG